MDSLHFLLDGIQNHENTLLGVAVRMIQERFSQNKKEYSDLGGNTLWTEVLDAIKNLK